jgi:hypothetical protein
MITRKCSEIAVRTGRFHISIVDASPLMRMSGYPEPDSLYARCTSSTGTVVTGLKVTPRSLLSLLIIYLQDWGKYGRPDLFFHPWITDHGRPALPR